jgi:hypothetical protein
MPFRVESGENVKPNTLVSVKNVKINLVLWLDDLFLAQGSADVIGE